MNRRAFILWNLLAVVILCLVYSLRTTFKNHTSPRVLTQTKPLVRNLPTEVKVIPVVVVKKRAAESLLRVDLPAGHSVTATADLKPSETGYDVLSVIDENTGVSTLQKTEKPRSAFGFPMTGRVKLGGGISSTGGNTVKTGLEFTPFRVGPVYITAEGELRVHETARPERYVGAFMEYRF